MLLRKEKIFLIFCILAVLHSGFAAIEADAPSQEFNYSEEILDLADDHLKQGKEYFDKGDLERALEEFETVLDLQPKNELALEYRLKSIQQMSKKNREEYAGKTIRQTGALESYREGLEALKKGQTDLAIKKLRMSVALDPYYYPSKRLLKKLLNKKGITIEKDQYILRKERLNDVRDAWLPTGKANKITMTEEEIDAEIISEAKRKMLDATKQVIPEINFTQAHIRDVLTYLSKITGVNIILDERVFQSSMPQVTTFEETSEEEILQQAAGPISETITISLSNIPLIEALRYILKVKGLKYRIDDYAIMVSTPEGIGDEEMETRYYHLSQGSLEFTEFKLNEAQANPGIRDEKSPFGGGLQVEDKTTIKDILINSGVPFPPGSSVFMDKRTGTLIVHNSPENLTKIEKVLEILDKPPFQVNIQAKFVRISQADLEELGFEWLLKSPIRIGSPEGGENKVQVDAGGTNFDDLGNVVLLNNAFTGTTFNDVNDAIDFRAPNMPNLSSTLAISGILTDPQFRVIIHALDKSGNMDVLSAPSVTTVNNQQAQIELVDEIIYPSEYDLQPAVISETAVIEGFSVPSDFITRDVGVILNVTPSVGADRKTITLTLIPEVSELKDFMDYGVTTVQRDPATNRIIGETYIKILQPVFHSSNVSTTVIVNDGETVVLGGLIEEKKIASHDKIPLLGDIPLLGKLFRNDIEQMQKINLMIFVTARLINASGEDLHPSRREKTV